MSPAGKPKGYGAGGEKEGGHKSARRSSLISGATRSGGVQGRNDPSCCRRRSREVSGGFEGGRQICLKRASDTARNLLYDNIAIYSESEDETRLDLVFRNSHFFLEQYNLMKVDL